VGAREQQVPSGSTICPQCNVRGPVRLAVGEVCAACKAQNAWALSDGNKLVIDQKEIDQALSRRAGEAAREKKAQRVWALVPAGLALAAAIAAIVFAVKLSLPKSIGSLDDLLSGMRLHGALAGILGVHALGIGAIALWRSQKTRHFRRWSLLVANLIAIVGGTISGIVGGLNYLAGDSGLALAHTTMPAKKAFDGMTPLVDRIVEATAVIVAPDKDGDLRTPALGTGAVIATNGSKAWIVTCSHVAMPYWGVGTWRNAAKAQPVWVQFSDGRSVVGRIAWTAQPPLDVAVVEAEIEAPPRPVALSADTASLDSGAKVFFVPLPFRGGWMVHHGQVQRREEHVTPAGPYSLLYTDLPVQPGDSGSGLFDEEGRLVGLNTWTRMGAGPPQGISLPSEAMQTIIDAIREGDLDRLEKLLPGLVPPAGITP
jgi:S1-C subfamily serine protease